MKTIKVELKGETPLLMNSPASMIEEQIGTIQKTTAKRNLKKDADKLAYKLPNGELYIPAEAIKGALVNASAYKKFGKNSARPIISGGVQITPNKISLKTKKYELDIRTVVIQRARIVKARPMIENWKVQFEIQYDETFISSPQDIKAILEEAGKRIGLLDFRPQKLGSFGKFTITSWKEL